MRIYDRYILVLASMLLASTVILAATGVARLDLYFSIYLIETLALTELYVYLNPKAKRGLNAVSYVLFADIRHFTQISEQMSPEAIVNMLNTYLSVMIDKVLQNDGMVNKFVGDNIMAVWNVPYSQEGHAQLAVRAAWEAQQEIIELQQRDPSLPRVQFGVGINTGEALAGNVGSLGRVEYTVIGDAVNLSSRICGAAPGGEVWIGPETYRQTADYLQVEELEPQTFKGKIAKVVVYRVVGWR